MLAHETLQRLQKYHFEWLAHQEHTGSWGLRYMPLAHIKKGKIATEIASALRVTRRAVIRWVYWFASGGVDQQSGMPHDWDTQRLPKAQEEAFCQAVELLQPARRGGRVRGGDIRQLLAQQFAVAYSLNRVYDLLKRLHMSWISVRSVSPHADPLKQAEFKKIVQQVKAILPRDIGLDQVHIWSQDEMWVGQRSTQTRLWAREGTRPQVVRQ